MRVQALAAEARPPGAEPLLLDAWPLPPSSQALLRKPRPTKPALDARAPLLGQTRQGHC